MLTVGAFVRLMTGAFEGPAVESVVANFFDDLPGQPQFHYYLPYVKSSSHGLFDGLESVGKLGSGGGAEAVDRVGATEVDFSGVADALEGVGSLVFVDSAARIARRRRSAGVKPSSGCAAFGFEANGAALGAATGAGLCLTLLLDQYDHSRKNEIQLPTTHTSGLGDHSISWLLGGAAAAGLSVGSSQSLLSEFTRPNPRLRPEGASANMDGMSERVQGGGGVCWAFDAICVVDATALAMLL